MGVCIDLNTRQFKHTTRGHFAQYGPGPPPPTNFMFWGGGVFGKDKGLTPPLTGNRGFEPGFERLIQNISYAKMVHIKTFNYNTIS